MIALLSLVMQSGVEINMNTRFTYLATLTLCVECAIETLLTLMRY